ncbi:MAG: hypothetical protein KBC22_01310 [Candidatus Pacebacteria bacterium]|nr:hypothetical protein [Candidatus Paceibacterota bacterium]
MDDFKPNNIYEVIAGQLPLKSQKIVFNHLKEVAKEFTSKEESSTSMSWYLSKEGIYQTHVRDLLLFFNKSCDQFPLDSNELADFGIDLFSTEGVSKDPIGLESNTIQTVLYVYYSERVRKWTKEEVEGRVYSNYALVAAVMHHFSRVVLRYLIISQERYRDPKEMLMYGIIDLSDYYTGQVKRLAECSDEKTASEYAQYFLEKGSYWAFDE